MSFSIDCEYCVDALPLLSASPPPETNFTAWANAWKVAAESFGQVRCSCGAEYQIQDDAVEAVDGGSVTRLNVTKPRVDALTFGSGARNGGETLYVIGEALDVGALVVRFGGKPAPTVTHRTSTRARVVTPVGQFTLNVEEINRAGFIIGEEVRGAVSGSRGSIRTITPFVVDAPTLPFAPHEEVVGQASNARLTLKGAPFSGAVDVTVENEHGQRLVEGTLPGGFTYA